MSRFYNPYGELSGGSWQKCNFHGHTEQRFDEKTFSIIDNGFDGLARAYKSAGFDAVSNSHKSKWIDYSALADELQMSIFPAQEHVVEYDGIVLVHAKRFYDCPPQEAIDGCIADGGFCYLAHANQNPALKFPGIPGGYPYDVIDSLTGLTGLEIYNGCLPNRAYREIPFGNGLATDVWDQQLSQGKRYWGFASDDAHEAYEINTGWTEVYAPTARYEDIHAAVCRGALCACRGLRLFDLKMTQDGLLSVRVDHTYMPVGDITYRFIGSEGRVLKQQRGETAAYRLTDEMYVRVEAVADDGSMIWLQPILNRAYFQVLA